MVSVAQAIWFCPYLCLRASMISPIFSFKPFFFFFLRWHLLFSHCYVIKKHKSSKIKVQEVEDSLLKCKVSDIFTVLAWIFITFLRFTCNVVNIFSFVWQRDTTMAAHNVAAFHGGMQCQPRSMKRAEFCPGLCWRLSGSAQRLGSHGGHCCCPLPAAPTAWLQGLPQNPLGKYLLPLSWPRDPSML